LANIAEMSIATSAVVFAMKAKTNCFEFFVEEQSQDNELSIRNQQKDE
jgi:hypothetical protein